jgi:hypothetical protein
MEKKGSSTETAAKIIADSLKMEKNSKNIARNFHPVYGKPYFDIPGAPGNSLKKNNNQYRE